MVALVEKIAREGSVTRQSLREAVAKPKAGRPKRYTFKYLAPTKTFDLRIQFRKSKVERDEIISTLESILDELRRQ